MHSWPNPSIPVLEGEVPALALYDTADDSIKPVERPADPSADVGIYVCGITPYDSTHLGHAATYLTFDLINRYLMSGGIGVHYVQNITDVDDPLFERAERDGVDWRELGTSQVDLFRSDMEQLSVVPPRHYIGAMESIDEVVDLVTRLLEVGAAYQLEDDEYADVYADYTFTSQFGYESRYDKETMDELFAERGGDPERPGKRHPLDALLWRAHRDGEPEWEAPFGAGRPGWHIECSAIALNRLGTPFAIQGGGSDLRFPHHEFSAAHAEAASGCPRMAHHYVHSGMIGLDGTKMSKSLGNLVFVHKLVEQGHDPSAIRVGLFASHYRDDRDWSEQILAEAEQRLELWRSAWESLSGSPQASAEAGAAVPDTTEQLIFDLRTALSQDLDTPEALRVMDSWAHSVNTGKSTAVASTIEDALFALLGVRLSR
ncbi:cysteine--1-D-myo-inosityl 2-amino-2-deoxy-alpha-D-glucopyranoside ligase [Corynebacterium dentalis]|uniref:cysteine--1-D-myo-inosityl 2-amino-2-deoxy-alpha-D-glucopyranoside ligase n=1 Tax=Corynebacterium dentalis TaxID=2014528 RepID=UPI000C0857AC